MMSGLRLPTKYHEKRGEGKNQGIYELVELEQDWGEGKKSGLE